MDNIKTFWGSDHKVGVTMIAQAYAETLVAKGARDVLLLSISEGRGDDFYDENAPGVNELRNRLSCNLITKEYMQTFAHKGAKIYKINGFKNMIKTMMFTKEMGESLLRNASDAFDFVVVDGGTGINNPLLISALNINRNNTYVFSQQESSLRNWGHVLELIKKMAPQPSSAIINKYVKGDRYTVNYIAQRTGLPQNIFKTVSESDFGNQAEADRQTLLAFGEKQFQKDINNLMN